MILICVMMQAIITTSTPFNSHHSFFCDEDDKSFMLKPALHKKAQLWPFLHITAKLPDFLVNKTIQ
jgi:hypothetical protein